MKFKCLFFFALSVFCKAVSVFAHSSSPGANVIVENKGQITDQYNNPRNDIDFRLVGKGVTMFVGSGHLHYQWAAAATSAQIGPIDMYRMDVAFIGANPNSVPRKVGQLTYTEKYFNKNSELSVQSFEKVIYPDLYPHIDWVLYLKNGLPEYDFIIHPGGKVSDIQMQYLGTSDLKLSTDGSLHAITPMGEITEAAPIAFANNKEAVQSKFLLKDNKVSFTTSAYNGELRIDPTIDWATYYGGTLTETPYQIVSDDSGNVYMAGSTASTSNIATTGAFQNTYGGGTGNVNYMGDAFLSKFNSLGQCIWATYYGGTGTDLGTGVAIDTAHNIYLAGCSNSSSSIATTGSYQSALAGGYDAFLVQFSPSGNRQWATYFGGTGNENAAPVSVSCDTSGKLYISGTTNSTTGIATTGAYQTTIGGGNDGFLAKFNPDGSIQWSTYFGGSSAEVNYKVVCAIDGGVFIGGQTPSSSNISTSGTHQQTYGGGANDAYLVKFSTSGSRLWSTYFGGSGYDRLTSILPDIYGNLYISGITNSTSNIATINGHQTTAGGGDDIFVAKFNSTGNRIWSTYYGSTGAENIGPNALAFDAMNRLYVCGRTNSTTSIATSGSLQSSIGGSYDGLIVKLDTAGTRIWGTYYGGVDIDNISTIATKGNGIVFLGGESNSSVGIATTGAFQTSFAGGSYDAILLRLIDCDTPAVPTTITGPASVCKGKTYQYSTPAVPGANSYTWTFPVDWVYVTNGNAVDVTIGALTGNVTVAAGNSCSVSADKVMAINTEVVATISPAGVQSFCADDSLLLDANIGTGLSYQWMKNGSAIAGATNQKYYVNTAGLFRVIVSNANCTDTSIADTLLVNPLPVPTIQPSGSDLVTESYFVSFQWNFEGNAITGAVNNTYPAMLDGHYTVTVTDTNGCSATSAIYTKGLPDNVSVIKTGSYGIHPNPATDKIEVVGALGHDLDIISLDGRTVLHTIISGSIDISELPRGIYILKISTSGKVTTTNKLIVE